MNKQLLVGAAALLACAAAANAAIAWSSPSGSQAAFIYNSGQSDAGLFGDGVSDADGFILAPANFVASANQANSPVNTTDTVSVVVQTGGPLIGVEVNTLGDYSIFGTGSVDATGTLKITDLDTSAVHTLPVSFGGVPTSTTTDAAGAFSGLSVVPIAPSAVNAKIELLVNLNATAGSNSTSLIQLKDVDIKLVILPEPTSLAAIGLACTLLGRRARR